MEKKNLQLAILLALAGVGLWLWFSRSGQRAAQAAGAVAATGAEIIVNLTRGERNNNPGNIRISTTPWQGKVAASSNTDGAFEQFDSAEHGIRALARTLFTYWSKYGLTTVRAIISRWAPQTENPTTSYIDYVAGQMGVAPDDTLALSDPGTLASITKAIIAFENGRNSYTDAQIEQGAQSALT